MTKYMGELSASLTTGRRRRRLHIQRGCYKSYLDEELGLQQRRHEMHRHDRGVCGLMLRGAGSGGQELIPIAERRSYCLDCGW